MVATFDSKSASIGTLVLAASEGDENAYSALYERYAGRLLARLSASFSRELAEDAAQEAWATAFQRLTTIQNPDAFFAWLLTIARNSARNSLRQQRAGRTVPLDVHGEAIIEEGGDPASVAEAGESQQAARELLGRLPRRQRDALRLRWFEELSYREIARRLTLSVSAVETLIYRARSNFHRHYESAERNQTPVVLACYKIRESLPPLVAGALGESRRRRVLAHVTQCTRCTRALATLNNAGPVRSLLPVILPLGWVRTRVLDLLQTLGRSGSQLAAGGAAAGGGVIVATTILTGLASSPAQSAATAGTEQATPITAVSGREHAASVSDEARLVPPVAESAPSISAVSARTASDSEHTANAVLAGETSSSQTRLSVSGGDAGTPEKVSAPEPQGVLGSGLGLTVSLATGLGGVVEDIVSEVGAIPVVDGVTGVLSDTLDGTAGQLELTPPDLLR